MPIKLKSEEYCDSVTYGTSDYYETSLEDDAERFFNKVKAEYDISYVLPEDASAKIALTCSEFVLLAKDDLKTIFKEVII